MEKLKKNYKIVKVKSFFVYLVLYFLVYVFSNEVKGAHKKM